MLLSFFGGGGGGWLRTGGAILKLIAHFLDATLVYLLESFPPRAVEYCLLCKRESGRGLGSKFALTLA